MQITVEVKATELADAINNLAVALGDMMAQRNEMKAVKTAEAAVTKAKKPVAPAPAPSEPTPPPVAEGSASEVAAPTTYEELRNLVAPLLANPATKVAVSKQVKKFCTGSLKDIKVEDYPALVEALQGLGK